MGWIDRIILTLTVIALVAGLRVFIGLGEWVTYVGIAAIVYFVALRPLPKKPPSR